MTHVARSSLIIAFFFGVDKVFGFARQILVARLFGLSYDIDVFNAANNIPDLLSALISGGALGVALIPVISECLETQGRRDAWLLFARISHPRPPVAEWTNGQGKNCRQRVPNKDCLLR